MAIVVKNAGKTIPDTALQAIMEANKSSFGVALVIGSSKDGNEMTVVRSPEPIALEGVKEIMKENEAAMVIFSFGNQAEGFQEDDIQPVTLIEEGEGDDAKPLVVAFISGDFPDYAKPEGSFLPSTNFAESFLGPLLQKAYDKDPDIGKLFDDLKDDITKKMINTQGKDTAIVLLGITGEPLMFGTSAKITQFDWGTVSDPYGYTETKEEPAKDKGVISSALDKLRGKKPTTGPAADTTKVTETTATAAKGSTAASSGTVKIPEKVLARPPAGLSNKKTRKWYYDNLGSLPSNWEERPEVPIDAPAARSLADIGGGKTDKTPAAPGKDTTPAHIPATPAPGPAPDKPSETVEETEVTSIPETDREKIVAEFLELDEIKSKIGKGKTVDVNALVKEFEEKSSSLWSDQTGYDFLDTTLWDSVSFHKMGIAYGPESMTSLWNETRLQLLQVSAKLAAVLKAQQSNTAKPTSTAVPTAPKPAATKGTSALDRFRKTG